LAPAFSGCLLPLGRIRNPQFNKHRVIQYWTAEHSCSVFQFKDIGAATAARADFGGEEFLEDEALE
jgi:hypothetical protein